MGLAVKWRARRRREHGGPVATAVTSVTWTNTGSNTAVFADGGTGHVFSMGSAPLVGQLDVLCVNSDTTVSTPSGFTALVTAVANQGAYIFTRIASGGEGSTVTITTTGNFNTAVGWSRWSAGTIVTDKTASAQINTVSGTASPAVTTPVLSQGGELVIAFAANHNLAGTLTNPVWSSGYTNLTTCQTGPSGASNAQQFVAYNTNAGTAAESPSVTWTTAASDRYMLAGTFEL